MSKYIYIGILLLVVVLCFSVLGSAQEAKFKIGYASECFGTAYSMSMVNGARDEAKALGIDLIVMDGQESVERQVRHVEDFVAQECDLIIIHPNNARVLGLKGQWAQSMGIPVLSISMMLDPPSVGLVEIDWQAAAKAQAEEFAKAIGYKGKIVEIQGLPGTSAKIQREEALQVVLKKYPDIELLDSKPANWNRADGLKIMESFLQAYPQIDGAYVHNDDEAVGVVQAVKAAGRKGIIIMSCDGQKETLDMIKSGDQYGTIAVWPYDEGRLAIYLANYILTQKDKDLWKKMCGRISLEYTVVNPENVEEFEGY